MAQLSGTVTSLGQPLKGVSVKVGNKGTTTSRTGYYRIQNLTVGVKMTVFSKLGYQPFDTMLTIKKTNNVFNLEMVPVAPPSVPIVSIKGIVWS